MARLKKTPPLGELAEPRHPSGRELTDFERWLLRLRLIGHEASQVFCSALKNEERKADSTLVFVLHNYGLIIICRFLEIWRRFNALGKSNRRVREACAIAAPLLDRIHEWPGLEEYRDFILAHRYQIGDRPEFIPPWVVLRTGRVPSKPAEWFVLLDCVRMASATVMAFFGEIPIELDAANAIGEEPEVPHGLSDPDDADVERRRLSQLMDQRMREAGVDLRHPIFRTLICRGAERPSE
jgi:hypothetical protein